MSHLLVYLVAFFPLLMRLLLIPFFLLLLISCPSVLSSSLVASAFPPVPNPMCSVMRTLLIQRVCDEDLSFSQRPIWKLTEPCQSVDSWSAFQLREIYLLKWLLFLLLFLLHVGSPWLISQFLIFSFYFHLYVLLLWGLRYFFLLDLPGHTFEYQE